MHRRPENPLADRLLAAQLELSALSATADAGQGFESSRQDFAVLAPQFAQHAAAPPSFRQPAQPTPVVIHRRRRIVLHDEPQAMTPDTDTRARESRVYLRQAVVTSPASEQLQLQALADTSQDVVEIAPEPLIGDLLNTHVEVAPLHAPPRRRRRHPEDHRPSAVTVIRPALPSPAEVQVSGQAAAAITDWPPQDALSPAIAREQVEVDQLLDDLAKPRRKFKFDLLVNARAKSVLSELDALEVELVDLLASMATARPKFVFDLTVNTRCAEALRDLDALEVVLSRPVPLIELP